MTLLLCFLVWYWQQRRAPTGMRARVAESISGWDRGNSWRVELIENDAYVPALLAEIRQAVHSIDVAMFVIRPGPESSSPTNLIMAALQEAAARQVRVRVILDRPEDPSEPHFGFNSIAAAHLRAGGVQVRFDNPSRELHAKFIVFDNKAFLIGAHNWTDVALTKNNELSVLARPAEPFPHPARAFDELWWSGTDPEEIERGRFNPVVDDAELIGDKS